MAVIKIASCSYLLSMFMKVYINIKEILDII